MTTVEKLPGARRDSSFQMTVYRHFKRKQTSRCRFFAAAYKRFCRSVSVSVLSGMKEDERWGTYDASREIYSNQLTDGNLAMWKALSEENFLCCRCADPSVVG